MAILIDETKRVLVQGITGREGRARTKLMREYGTNVVAGVTPGKAGQTVLGVPVFNTPQEAVKALGGIDISVLFVPAAGVKEAAISAIDAGIKLTVLVPDRVPVWDAMEIASSQEEELAQMIRDRKVTKPVIAYIGGKAAREGTRFSHAGAIIEGGRGTHAGKVKALREAGATVVDAFGELPGAVVEILKRMKGQSLMSEADRNAVWNTAVTRIEPNRVAVRGYDIANLMGRASFGAAVHLILTGELPTPPVARLMDAILVASIDHGATPPSALAARTAASTGASLSASVAAGIMSINRHHGGAIEDCARQLKAIADRATKESISIDEAATRTLAAMRETGERMSGFGHRVHTKDPRTSRLLELAREAGIDGVHMKAARAVEKSFADAKKALPINVDGAIGAILADLGMNPAAFNGIFMIARTPGLVAHVIEEQSREKPMRRIDPVNHGYDGPAPRSLTTNRHE